MSTRVFVGGLTYRVRERDLEKFFRKYGRIKEVAMKNGFAFVERDLERFFRGYGRFRDVLIKNGYGFVEFDDYRDADDAVYELNGKELLGERITVERARGTPRGSDQWRYGDSRGGYGDSRRSARDDMRHDRYGPPTRTEYRLTVENLSSRVSWQLLPPVFRMDIKMTGRMEILFLAKIINQCGQPNSHTQTMSNTNGGQSKRRWAMQHRLCGKYQGAEHELIQNIRNEYYKKKNN
ncbi:hypothetical protein PV325_010345 [Microctonus aethiopoides]|nr:hypothetical protein PV325_010345 [Microctonus aethiopoides]